jgi:acyl carrier protein
MSAPLTIDDAKRVLREALGAKVENLELSATTPLDALEVTSLEFAEVFFVMEEQMGIELEPIRLGPVETVGELIDEINAVAVRAAGTGPM